MTYTGHWHKDFLSLVDAQGQSALRVLCFVARVAGLPLLAGEDTCPEVAIGMPVTRHPSHRSQRALLKHRAPALSFGVKANCPIRMDNTHCGKVAGHDAVEASHRHTMTLAAPAQGSEPVPANTAKEEVHATVVARHTKIILVT